MSEFFIIRQDKVRITCLFLIRYLSTEVHGVGLTSASDLSRFTWVVESFNEGWSPESRVEFKKHLTYNVSRIVPVTQEEARSKALTRSSLPNPEHNEDEGNGESLSHPGTYSGYNHLYQPRPGSFENRKKFNIKIRRGHL